MKFVAVVTRKASSRQKHFSRICLRRPNGQSSSIWKAVSARSIRGAMAGGAILVIEATDQSEAGDAARPIAPADPVGHRRH